MCDKQIMKPVWRMNSGKGVPSDLGDAVLILGINFGEKYRLLQVRKHMKKDSDLWSKGDILPIAAYQTTRTRKAKYNRVECNQCEGSGSVTLLHMPCPQCNGKGYKWELV